MTIEPGAALQEAVHAQVMRDLEPSWQRVHTLAGGATIGGGLLSLAVCGQFGLGLTPWATSLNHLMHAHLQAVGCAAFCGLLYAFFPLAALRFGLATPLLFRVIIKRHKSVLALWSLAFGASLASLGEHGQDLGAFLAWCASALAATNGLARLIVKLMPTWSMRAQSSY